MASRVVTNGTVGYDIEGDGPPVLLVHSLGTSRHLWAKVASLLSDEFTLVSPDLLGHGESSSPTYEFAIPDHADALAEFASDLGYERYAVVGTSLGALVGIEMGARYGAHVSSLVLNGCPGWHLQTQRMSRFRTIARKMVNQDGLVREDALGGGTIRPLSEEDQKRRRLDLDRCGRWFLSSLWAVSAYDPIAALADIEVPTMILMGDGDFHLSTSYALEAGVRGSRLEVIENAGHLTPYDDPEGVAARVRGFLNSR